ncbi:hypothetical protein BO71DRAFT_154302 [Aspergillus ellipticus CBS 707.79]|uniref:Uncharacterized protein n=1 Tax=Aspergillus ellipticus CBS 707.79 TaxID=1448320 RepID=A0A319DHI2_9EURO|nr:hypothetical protein BO71DRAFT_154302 [Aspergillus ellipticus CBS 707.79]
MGMRDFILGPGSDYMALGVHGLWNIDIARTRRSSVMTGMKQEYPPPLSGMNQHWLGSMVMVPVGAFFAFSVFHRPAVKGYTWGGGSFYHDELAGLNSQFFGALLR